SKSRAIPKPVKTPPNAADWSRTNTNWKAVYPFGKSKPGMLSTRDSPPANAVKKKSGKIIPGRNSDGVVNTLCSTRQATANATDQKAPLAVPASGRAGLARVAVGADRSNHLEAHRKRPLGRLIMCASTSAGGPG